MVLVHKQMAFCILILFQLYHNLQIHFAVLLSLPVTPAPHLSVCSSPQIVPITLVLGEFLLISFASPTQSGRLYIPTKPTGLSLPKRMGSTQADKPWFKVTGASCWDCRSSADCSIGHLFICCCLLPVPEGVWRSFFLQQQGKHSIGPFLQIQYKALKLCWIF